MKTSSGGFYRRFGKRLFDLLVAIPILVLIAPLLPLIWLCSRLFVGKPVLFRQTRPGYLEKPFTIYKFRTMADIRDERGALLPDSARLTAYGRLLRSTSLDELPELWNVLKGDMALVGPRPLLPQYLPRYSAFQQRRHEVRPGITGRAQVNGRNALDWERRFELDVWYVDHRSFWLDVKILFLTITAVLSRDGIAREGHATMSEFLGSPNVDSPNGSGVATRTGFSANER